MTYIDFCEVASYINNKTGEETVASIYRGDWPTITNSNFKYVKLIGSTCCIRHKDDFSKKAIMYKTVNGAKKYINKWVNKDEVK